MKKHDKKEFTNTVNKLQTNELSIFLSLLYYLVSRSIIFFIAITLDSFFHLDSRKMVFVFVLRIPKHVIMTHLMKIHLSGFL